jgi:type VI protein secretion system component Hcp
MAILMHLPGVPGESETAGYAGWHALTGFTWGASRSARSQAARSLRGTAQVWTPQLRNIVVRRKANGQTAALWRQMLSANPIPLVKFEWVRTGAAGPVPYFTVEITTARIVSLNDSSEGSHPIEQIEFHYQTITLGTRNVGNQLTGAQDLVTYSIPVHAGG